MAAAFDPRVTPARPDLAAAELADRVEAARYVAGEARQVIAPAAPLSFTAAADARLESELLFGERFTVYEDKSGWAWGQAALDGYVGYLPAAALGAWEGRATHVVGVPRAHLYPAPAVKTRARHGLSLGARLRIVDEADGYGRLQSGDWVYARHLAEIDAPAPDWVATALSLAGAPYVWGGRSADGLDCSALVQLALQRAGRDCPRDSDQQAAALGAPVETDDLTALRRGDLVYWPDHVGIALGDGRLLHANATWMQVVAEPFADVLGRGGETDPAAITAIRRLVA